MKEIIISLPDTNICTRLNYRGAYVEIKAHHYHHKEDVALAINNDQYLDEVDATFYEAKPHLIDKAIFIDSINIDIYSAELASTEIDKFMNEIEKIYNNNLIFILPYRAINVTTVYDTKTVGLLRENIDRFFRGECHFTTRNFLQDPSVYVNDYYDIIVNARDEEED